MLIIKPTLNTAKKKLHKNGAFFMADSSEEPAAFRILSFSLHKGAGLKIYFLL
jgi:hypothetical protein